MQDNFTNFQCNVSGQRNPHKFYLLNGPQESTPCNRTCHDDFIDVRHNTLYCIFIVKRSIFYFENFSGSTYDWKPWRRNRSTFSETPGPAISPDITLYNLNRLLFILLRVLRNDVLKNCKHSFVEPKKW